MGRKQKVPDYEIGIAIKEIESETPKHSLRSKAKSLNMHPSSLADRIKKYKLESNKPTKPDIKTDTLMVNKEIKPDKIKELTDNKKIKPDKIKELTDNNPTKPDNKLIPTDNLRAIHILLFKEGSRDNKITIINKIITRLKDEIDGKNNI